MCQGGEGDTVYGAMLILDRPRGVLKWMIRGAPHDEGDPMPGMGMEVEEAARAILGSERG